MIEVVAYDPSEERRTLAFRDYLRDHDDVAQEYERLKRTIAARFLASDPEARARYARAKTDFIERIVAMALTTGYPRDVPTYTS